MESAARPVQRVEATAWKRQRGSDSVEATACIMIHGVVTPVRKDPTLNLGCKSYTHQPCSEYTLTGTPLPNNVHLYAPSILGYEYYDANRTDTVIKERIANYKKSSTRQSYNKFLLSMFKRYETYNRDRVDKKVKNEYDLGIVHGSDRSDRLSDLSILTIRSQLVWLEHSHYITEKMYTIYPDPMSRSSTPPRRKPLPSCIIIFCDNLRNDFNVDTHINYIYNMPHTTHISSYEGKSVPVKYSVRYDETSSTFTIDFGDTDLGEDSISFEDIKNIILFLLLGVSPVGTYISNIDLSIFDLTCSVLDFPEITASGLEPVMLSSIDDKLKDKSRLVYGTIQENTRSDIQQQHERSWSSIYKETDFNEHHLTLSPTQSPHPFPTRSPTRSPTPSPGPPGIHIVYLSDDVKSFVNFKLFPQHQSSLLQPGSVSPSSLNPFEYPQSFAGSTSVSSYSSSNGGLAMLLGSDSDSDSRSERSIPRPGDGGNRRSHRTHTRRCRSRHHPRVGKKVSLRHGRRRRRGTKANSTRSNRKRKTTK